MGVFLFRRTFVWDKKYCRGFLIFLACLLPLETVISQKIRLFPKNARLNDYEVLDLQRAKAEERYLPQWFHSQMNPVNTLSPSRSRVRRSHTQSSTPVGVLREKTLFTPVTGCLTSPYGRRGRGMHWGIDLAAPQGAPVRAAASGSVDYAGWASGYGLLVILDHGGFRTFYAHNSCLRVNKGQKLRAGETIAEVGRTGRATGNHLHFEVEVKGVKIDPLPYLKR